MGNCFSQCWTYLRSFCCGVSDGGLLQQEEEEIEDNESEESEEVAWWEHDPVDMEIDENVDENDFVDFNYDNHFVEHLLDLMVREEQRNEEVIVQFCNQKLFIKSLCSRAAIAI